MNIKDLTVPILTAMGLFCSCSHEIEQITMKPDNKESYAIPIETALNSLDDFLVSRGTIPTKGGIHCYIENYFVVSGGPDTKGIKKDSLLYVINFKDGQGYALISADKRISDDIIAVTEQGSASEEDFISSDEELTPAENDDLAVEVYNDMVESGALAQTTGTINRECLRYARMELQEHEGSHGTSGTVNSGGNSSSQTITYQWETEKEVPMLMNTIWTQEGDGNLFNKYCPEVGLIWKRTAPAGCVCIAVSQIIAFHEYPTSLACNGLNIDYAAIKKLYSFTDPQNTGTPIDKEMMAQFILNVGGWCGTKYHSIFGKSWGFAWPSGAKECMSTFGYDNVTLNWGYDEDTVINSLDNGCPVFMSAIAKLISGHAWVIDGYIKRNRVASTGTITERQTLVHCNWGWHGNCNGYFTSGVFKTNEAQISDGFRNTEDERYWCAFNTITYDNPDKKYNPNEENTTND